MLADDQGGPQPAVGVLAGAASCQYAACQAKVKGSGKQLQVGWL